MAQTPNEFGAALAAHEGSALKAAFERANQAADRPLHRTTLGRWLDGALPNNEDFVRRLAAELRDDNVLEAWHATRGTRSSSTFRSVVSRYENLSPDERLLAYPEIRRLFLETRFPQLYNRLRYRVEVNDSPEASADYLMVRLDVEEDAFLPAGAKVTLTTTHGKLSDAYEDQSCIFRDRIPLEPEEFYASLEAGQPPVLTYNHLDSAGQRMIRPEGTWSSQGVFEFQNDAVEYARIRLRFEYPYPRGLQLYPIRFGEYRVAGGAEFSLVLNAASTSSPQAFAFPPAGRQREWAVQSFGANELVASMGAGGSILADGDGLILSWHESK